VAARSDRHPELSGAQRIIYGGQVLDLLSASIRAETEGPADNSDVAAVGRGLGLAGTITLPLLPAAGVAGLCVLASVAPWLLVAPPLAALGADDGVRRLVHAPLAAVMR
jgi:hypothetical protein